MAEDGCAYRPNPVGLISVASSGNLPDTAQGLIRLHRKRVTPPETAPAVSLKTAYRAG